MTRAGASPAGRRALARTIRRRPGPPHAIPLPDRDDTVYEIELSAAPSPAWRGAFLRPPARLMSARYTPELGRLGLRGTTVLFRTTPARARFWLRRIDRWVEYANSVVEK